MLTHDNSINSNHHSLYKVKISPIPNTKPAQQHRVLYFYPIHTNEAILKTSKHI